MSEAEACYQRAECRERAWRMGVTKLQTPDKRSYGMLKFIGGTAGIIFIIGLIVVIGLFKLVF
ncbi:MAG: small membrane protein YohP [Pseudomonadaceae bacterium]